MKTSEENNTKITVLIVDSEDESLDNIRKLLALEADFEVVGTAKFQDALNKIIELKPDIVLVDIDFPEFDWKEYVQQLTKIPFIHVILLSSNRTGDLSESKTTDNNIYWLSSPPKKNDLYNLIRHLYRNSDRTIRQVRNVEPPTKSDDSRSSERPIRYAQRDVDSPSTDFAYSDSDTSEIPSFLRQRNNEPSPTKSGDSRSSGRTTRSNRITMSDIAQQAGVSRVTVSRVMNNYPNIREEVRERVLKAIEETGYRPGFAARSLIASGNLVDTSFSLYAPSKVEANGRGTLYVYAYNSEYHNEVQFDIKKFREELGGEIPEARTAKQSHGIELGAEITIVPECEEIEFEPTSLTKKWHGDWTRYEFEFRPTDDLIDEMLFIRVSIRIKGLEISHIKTSCVVTATQEKHMRPVATGKTVHTSKNPLIQAKQRVNLSSSNAKPYTKMFISYSRQDQALALKRAREIEQILGAEVFIDVERLRAGDDWEYQLAKAIDDADVFHLLWSEHSASSEYCRHEWEYALEMKCPENMCVGIIRPIYWQKPVPKPPEELAHLHFEYVEMLDS